MKQTNKKLPLLKNNIRKFFCLCPFSFGMQTQTFQLSLHILADAVCSPKHSEAPFNLTQVQEQEALPTHNTAQLVPMVATSLFQHTGGG